MTKNNATLKVNLSNFEGFFSLKTFPKNILKEDLFPPWVVALMVNIEEATTHELVIEQHTPAQKSTL